jgi:hypothetical protein
VAHLVLQHSDKGNWQTLRWRARADPGRHMASRGSLRAACTSVPLKTSLKNGLCTNRSDEFKADSVEIELARAAHPSLVSTNLTVILAPPFHSPLDTHLFP